jgi:uncharacterized protein YdeI (YjbR/CyaY-like superfamily)
LVGAVPTIERWAVIRLERTMTKTLGSQIPQDVAAAFASHPEANRIFQALAPSHQREYVKWINEAKNPQARQRRIAKAIEMVLAKRSVA